MFYCIFSFINYCCTLVPSRKTETTSFSITNTFKFILIWVRLESFLWCCLITPLTFRQTLQRLPIATGPNRTASFAALSFLAVLARYLCWCSLFQYRWFRWTAPLRPWYRCSLVVVASGHTQVMVSGDCCLRTGVGAHGLGDDFELVRVGLVVLFLMLYTAVVLQEEIARFLQDTPTLTDRAVRERWGGKRERKF